MKEFSTNSSYSAITAMQEREQVYILDRDVSHVTIPWYHQSWVLQDRTEWSVLSETIAMVHNINFMYGPSEADIMHALENKQAL